jgi:membrane associated rhomboid family serine protease
MEPAMDRFYSSPSHQPDEPWFRIGTVDVNTTILICGLSIISMFVWAASSDAVNALMIVDHNASLLLYGHDVRWVQPWRLLTWPLANEASLATVLDIVMMFIFGREVERSLGRRRFLWFLAALVVIPGLVALGLGATFGGLFMLTTGLFVAFVATYPTAIGFFGIPLWVFGAVFIGIDILQTIGQRDGAWLILILVVCALGLLGARAFGLSHLEWIPRIPLPASISGEPTSRGPRPGRPTRRGRGRKGPATVTPIRPPSATPTSAELLRQAEIDVLLDKINEHGIASLTPEERRRLDEHSRRMRDER